MSEYNIQMNKYNALNAEYDQLYPATKIANVDGLDTALQNNDPRNWGLDLSKSLTDANDGTRNGFYAMTTGAANVPFDYGVLLVHNIGNPNYVHQELTHYSEGIKACRAGAWDDSISAIKWNPWEWVNPPMVIGVEYRTTERFNSRTVYQQVFSLGELSTAGKTEYYVFGEDATAGQHFIISANFYASNSRYGDGGWGITLPSFNVDSSVAMAACYNGLRVDWYNVKSFSGYYGFAILKYVKPYEAT